MIHTTAKLVLPLALLLTACATPREACVSRAQSPLRDLAREINRAETNIARGYRIVRVRDTQLALTQCVRRNREGEKFVYPCQKPVVTTRSEPVAVDIGEERAKLRRLIAVRAGIEARASRDIRACQAAYPATG